VDPAESHVEVLGPDGAARQRIGRPGADLGRLSGPLDVSVDGDRVYVADTGNRRIQVFDALSGGFLAAWPGLDHPAAVLAKGDAVWVAEPKLGQLVRFDRAGRRQATWGRDGEISLDLDRPVGLALGPDGDLYVADQGAGRVLRLNNGRETASFTLPDSGADGAPLDVAVGPENDLYIPCRSGLFSISRGLFGSLSVDLVSRRVGFAGVAVGPGDGLVASLVDAWTIDAGVLHFGQRGVWSDSERWTSVPAAVGSLQGPRRLAAREDGGAFLADGWPRVQSWRPGGVPAEQFRAVGVVDLAAGPEGSVLVVSGDKVERHSSDGSLLWTWPAPDGDAWLAAAAAEGDRLTILDLGRHELHQLSATNTAAPAASRIDLPGGLAVDLAAGGDQVLLADREAQVLRLVDAQGTERNRWPAPGRVIRVAAPPDGRAWFALTDDGWIWKYDPRGRLLAAWDAVPTGRPIDLDVNAAGGVLVVDGQNGRVHVFAPDPTGSSAQPPSFGDRCDLQPDKTAAPERVRAGRPVTVTLRVQGDCPSESLPLDVVLAVDRSGSMEGPKIEAARSVGADFAAELDFRKARAATVLFASQAELTQVLTDDAAAVIRGVSRARAGGGTNIADALLVAGEELAGPRAQPDGRQAVVLLTDGKPDGGLDPRGRALSQAADLRAAGVAVYAIGLGADVDSGLLTELAGDPSRYFRAPSAAELSGIYRLIARRLLADKLLRDIAIDDELPANMRYVQGSSRPPAAWDGSALHWRLGAVATDGLVLSYQVEPLQAGVWPTNVRALARYTDGVGHSGDLLFPVPQVEVYGGLKAYLPLVFQRSCPKQRSDVVLVIDTSSSMDESATPGGPSKMEAARTAAASFLDLLALPEDRAAVIGFNEVASRAADFGGDRQALRTALDRLPRATGTRIDRGLEEAARLMDGPTRDPGRTPVLILLTDGRTAAGTEAAARATAARLRDAGSYLFTIGLGPDVDGGLLVDIAGLPARYSYAPDQDALGGIYQLLAWSLPCR
jgi:Mg-chelatase subunit ChlD/DNA-binding beta-propeller fold protein YncE